MSVDPEHGGCVMENGIASTSDNRVVQHKWQSGRDLVTQGTIFSRHFRIAQSATS